MKRMFAWIGIMGSALYLIGWVYIEYQPSVVRQTLEQRAPHEVKPYRRGAFCYSEPCEFDGRRA